MSRCGLLSHYRPGPNMCRIIPSFALSTDLALPTSARVIWMGACLGFPVTCFGLYSRRARARKSAPSGCSGQCVHPAGPPKGFQSISSYSAFCCKVATPKLRGTTYALADRALQKLRQVKKKRRGLPRHTTI